MCVCVCVHSFHLYHVDNNYVNICQAQLIVPPFRHVCSRYCANNMFVMWRHAMCQAAVAIKMKEAIRPSAILFYMKLNIPVIFPEVSGTVSDECILTIATTSGGLFMVVNATKVCWPFCHVMFVVAGGCKREMCSGSSVGHKLR